MGGWKGLIGIGIGVLILIIGIAVVFRFVDFGVDTATEGFDSMDSRISGIQADKYLKFEGNLKGREVVQAARELQNDPAVSIRVTNNVGTAFYARTGSAVCNVPETPVVSGSTVASSAVCATGLLTARAMSDKTTPATYINPNGDFVGTYHVDANGDIRHLELVQR